MRTHIQIPEIHPANVGGLSKHEALKYPIALDLSQYVGQASGFRQRSTAPET
jgi:hypothetical protein